MRFRARHIRSDWSRPDPTPAATGVSAKNKYVKSVSLNGKVMPGFKLKHSDIVRGGRLVFEMDDARFLSHNGH